MTAGTRRPSPQPKAIRARSTTRKRSPGLARSARAFAVATSLLFTVLVWHVASILSDSALLPSPIDVARAGLELARNGSLLQHAQSSIRRALIGFVFGSLAGIFVGLLTGRFSLARLLIEPTLQVLRPIPGIAWVPLAILWLGVGEAPKLLIISLGVFFPVWLNTHLGVRGTPQLYVDVARGYEIGQFRMFSQIVLPAALPSIVSGLRLGFAISFILLVAAELTGASSGLGALISQSHMVFRPDRMLVGIASLGVLGAVVDQIFARAIRGVVYWED